MRITAAQRTEIENRIRAAMDRLLRGEIPPDGKCDVKTLAREADIDRTAFYGQRPYAHLREEFEQRLERLRQAGETPDPRAAQINRLKNEVTELKARLTHADRMIEELTDFRSQALSRLAAQQEEIITLRSTVSSTGNVIALPDRVARASR
jgi:chromosome segregation ATPase